MTHELARSERTLVLTLLVLGYAARIGWLFLEPAERLGPHQSEMWHVAAHFAQTGQLADAYGPGSGVSSHVGPFNTMLVGYIYRAFGVGSLTSELLLALLAAAVVCTLFWFLHQIAKELGIPVVARVAALAFVCLFPRNYYLEVVDFRIREGAFAAMIAAGMLLWLLRISVQRALSWRTLALFGLAGGFAFLVNPGVALGVYAGLGVIGLLYMPLRRWPAAAVMLLVTFLTVNGPWIARNYVVYDRLMVSRGNFGLELSIGVHPAAVDPEDPQKVFNDRMKEVHPFFSERAFSRLKTYPNDAAYFDDLGEMTGDWIKTHPEAFARIAARHLRELYFPSAWQFNLYDTGASNVLAKQAITWAISGFGLLGLLFGLARKPRAYIFVLLTFAFPTLLYVLVQPTPRYLYLFVGLLTFLAAGAVWGPVAGWSARRLPGYGLAANRPGG